ncbi:MAG: ribonuclease P protein component [Dysgonomonas sp.]
MTIKDTDIKKTFPKEEKLCRTKSIDQLFSKGESFIAYPLRVVYLLEDEQDEALQIPSVLINVSKKKFKRAVKRNRVKRLIREAYRLNKTPYTQLLKENGKRMDIAFLYLKSELPTFQEIEKSIHKAVVVLTEKVKGRSEV